MICKSELRSCFYGLSAVLADLISSVALLGAGCCFRILELGVMAGSAYLIVYIAFSARACMCSVSILGAGRRCDHGGVFIGFNAAGYKCKVLFNFTIVASFAILNFYFYHTVSFIKDFELEMNDNAIGTYIFLRSYPNQLFFYCPAFKYSIRPFFIFGRYYLFKLCLIIRQFKANSRNARIIFHSDINYNDITMFCSDSSNSKCRFSAAIRKRSSRRHNGKNHT